METYENFLAHLRKRVERADITHVAKLCGVERVSISQYLRYKQVPRLDRAMKIAKGLGLTLSYMLKTPP